MFGKNAIVGQRWFKDQDPPSDQLFVTSLFMTSQGEGPFRGKPAFFIRLAKCNLACSFCDTFFDDGEWLTFDQIDSRIKTTIDEYFNNNVPHYAKNYVQTEDELGTTIKFKPRDMVLVMTGGEPMLQSNIGAFLSFMESKFAHTQIESNGTLVQDIPSSTVLVVSPKCSERHGQPVKYLEPKQSMLERADCLKFVMSSDPTSPYNVVPDWALEWKNSTGKDIFVSPMNIYNDEPRLSKQLRMETNSISIEQRSKIDEVISWWEPGLLNMHENQKNHEYTAKYCIDNGLIFNMQLHLFAGIS